ncbi:MAG: hypothetical protein IPK93_03725 [Solirubrobacterales bacterium]|nr:hypothetical protein [Solirubrobacterales bacterium]
MKRIPRPSPAMVVAMISLIVAIGGTAVALPGKGTVGSNDLRKNSVGARSMGAAILGYSQVFPSTDPVAGDGTFTETEGSIRCPAKAPFAFDPSIGNMGPRAFEMRRNALPNRWGGPAGYRFIITSDEGPDLGFTMKVNCLPRH